MESKKRHIGLSILILILALILFIPIAGFGYLSLCGFHPAKMRTDLDTASAYQETVSIRSDGTVDIPITNVDCYFLLDQYKIVEEYLPSSISDMLKAYAVELKEGGFNLYVDAKVLGFIPLPLKFSVAAAYQSNHILRAKVDGVWIGKWISVPLDKLESVGVTEPLELDLDEFDSSGKITNVQFLPEHAVVSDAYMGGFSKELFSVIQESGIAQTLCIYETPQTVAADPALSLLARDFATDIGATFAADNIFAWLNAADQSPSATLTSLMSLCGPQELSALVKSQKVFEQHFILEPAAAKIAADSPYLSRVLAFQTVYENLLTGLRTMYQKQQLILDASGFTDASTQEPLLLSSTFPEANLDDANARIILIYSNTALNAVKTFDMPLLKDIPVTNKSVLRGIYSDIPYDLAIVLTLPSGVPACLYYQGDGQFVINIIDDGLWNTIMTARTIPVVISESLPRPPTRTLFPAPGPGLSKYSILIPTEESQSSSPE